ncbi:MAG TPA: hypothetical protein VKR42_13030 [Ktedonobacteraceae bacterium]|nr:hypothetical protein [Ktedonobacteraceae bacterium]
MANIAGALPNVVVQTTRSEKDLARLRLTTGFILILVSLNSVLGADWDIQWHAVIGRDRTFTPPHDMILIGIGLSGIIALASILIETQWTRHHNELRQWTTDFIGVLRSSTGSYLIGFGAICSAIAFPLDTYWHSLYGIDVSLWAPFHTMIYMGGMLSTFGIAYMLLSAAHLAEKQQERWTTVLSYAGVIVTLGIILSKLSTFLTPAISGKGVHLSFGTVSIFPLLLAACTIFVCVLAVRLIPWTGAATMAIVVFLLLLLTVSLFVPPMMSLLVQIEHQTYLARASVIGSRIVPLLGQTPFLLLASLSIDGVILLGRRAHWSPSTIKNGIVIASLVSMFFVAALTLILLGAGTRQAQGGGGGHVALAFLLALLLTIPGSLIGGWLGLTISGALQTLRR